MSKKLVAIFQQAELLQRQQGNWQRQQMQIFLRSNRYSHIQEQIWTG